MSLKRFRSYDTLDDVIKAYYRGEIDAETVMAFAESQIVESEYQRNEPYLPPRFGTGKIEEELATSSLGLQQAAWTRTLTPMYGETTNFYYPQWSSSPLIEKQALAIAIGVKFVIEFSNAISNATLCALSFPGLLFLYNIEAALEERNASILPIGSFSEDMENAKRKLILFDLIINTGQTATEVTKHFVSRNWRPSSFLFIFFNDLVPRIESRYPWDVQRLEWNYLYRASDFLKYWDGKKTAEALLQIKKVSEGKADWVNYSTQFALKHLADVVQIS